MNASNRSLLNWPATYALRILTACFFVAGTTSLGIYLFDSKEECEDCIEMGEVGFEAEFEEETYGEGEEDFSSEAIEVEPDYAQAQMGPGFTVSWRPPESNFRFCLRSGISHYSLPPE